MAENRIEVSVVFTYSGPNRSTVLRATQSTSDERDRPVTLELSKPQEIESFFRQVEAARHAMHLHGLIPEGVDA